MKGQIQKVFSPFVLLCLVFSISVLASTIEIYDLPERVAQVLGRPIASVVGVSRGNTGTKIRSMAAGDIDVDGTDEIILLMEELPSGVQWIEIYGAPEASSKGHGLPVATDEWVGQVGSEDEIVLLAAGDVNGRGPDEIVILRVDSQSGDQSLFIHNAPTTVAGDIGMPIVANESIGRVGTELEITHASLVDLDMNGREEIIVVAEDLSGVQALRVCEIPVAAKRPCKNSLAELNQQ